MLCTILCQLISNFSERKNFTDCFNDWFAKKRKNREIKAFCLCTNLCIVCITLEKFVAYKNYRQLFSKKYRNFFLLRGKNSVTVCDTLRLCTVPPTQIGRQTPLFPLSLLQTAAICAKL